MNKKNLWKWIVFAFFLAVSMALVYPPSEKIPLGIDLRGGTSFILELQMDKLKGDAGDDALDRALQVIEGRVNALGTREPIVYTEPKLNRIVVQVPGLKAENRDQMVNLLESAAYLEFRMVNEDSAKWTEENFKNGLAPEGYKIFNKSVAGVDGNAINRSYYIEDREAHLNPDADPDEFQDQLVRFELHAGNEFLLSKDVIDNITLYTPYYVNVRPQLTGESLEDARVDYQELGQPTVNLTFNKKGAKRFGNITASFAPGGDQNPNANNYRQLGIVLDGNLYSAPRINEPIYGGNAQISGSFSLQEAKSLAIVLRAGSLPAPVEVIEERGVDPTLGHDSISSGIYAMAYGAGSVVIFMLVYYMMGGVIANLALLITFLLLPFFMMVVSGFLGVLVKTDMGSSAIGLPTLTLPGIAGIILTLGMAVDANVLIFERIREEQKAGKRFKPALQAGYKKAFSTIMDANITTLITAVILFWQGSGPVRGFAVTLSAGILASMYAVLVVSRMIFEYIAEKKDIQSMKMFKLMETPNFNYLNKRYISIALSLIVIVGSWVVFYQKGDKNFGVDFTGGRAITYEFLEKQDVGEVRAVLAAVGIKDSFIQYQQEMTAGADGVKKELLEIKVSFESGTAAKDALKKAYDAQEGVHPDAAFKPIKEDSVGPQIGKELQKKGIAAIVWAMLGIVIYISWRFEFAFAMGAIFAVAHDVLVTVGIYCLMDRQLSLPIVAALLTIVGYSVNDTIVVFDRIREERKLIKDKTFYEIANLSINHTLGRTIITSVTTLLSVSMLLLFGGGAINDFALALFIGILVGTYSSIFVATPVVLLWHRDKK